MPISYTFAAEDLDNDGVEDSVDLCPNLKEDYEGAVDGCPSSFVPWYDEDYDGIQDHLDQCPNVRENYNMFQDEDGCPDIAPEGGKGGLPDRDGNVTLDACIMNEEGNYGAVVYMQNIVHPMRSLF